MKSLLIGWLNKDLQNREGASAVGRPSLLWCLSQWELLSEVNKSICFAPFTCLSYRVFILPFELVDVWRIPYFSGLLTIRCEVHSNLVQYEQWLDLTSILPFGQIWPCWVFGSISAGNLNKYWRFQNLHIWRASNILGPAANLRLMRMRARWDDWWVSLDIEPCTRSTIHPTAPLRPQYINLGSFWP
jgi:hypothetical protein